MQEAAKANQKGLALLSLGQPKAASYCFQEALRLFGSIGHTSIPPLQATTLLTPPLQIVPLSSIQTDDDPSSFSCSDNRVCLIRLVDKDGVAYEMTTELLSMCAVAVVANCAVACEHQASVAEGKLRNSWYMKASSLYRRCLELLIQTQHCFDCASLVQMIAQDMAGCLYELGDFNGVANLRNVMFQRDMYELAIAEILEESSISATAA